MLAQPKGCIKLLIKQRDAGAALLLISEDLDELLSLSDRIAVIYEGKLVGEMPAEGADIHAIGLMMAGIEGGRMKRLPHFLSIKNRNPPG